MNDSIDQAPNYPPEFWVAKASYVHVPITLDGPVARWADKLVEPYGYRWTDINEWRWVGGDVPFAQFVCQRPDGGRDWLTVTYVPPPPATLNSVTTRLL